MFEVLRLEFREQNGEIDKCKGRNKGRFFVNARIKNMQEIILGFIFP